MSTIGYINISLELFGGLLSLIFILCLSLGSPKKEELEHLYIRVLSINTAVLFSDAAAWLFKGHPDGFSFWMVRIANFLVFTFGYILLAVFTDYLVCFISAKGIGISRAPSRLMWTLTLAAIVLVVISQYNHMYYLIDSQNIYRRQRWFWISQMAGIICMLINGTILIRYRKYLSKKELTGLAAYIVLPVMAMLVQAFVYGIAVLYIATTVSALCIYISIQVEQSRKFSQEELELEKSRTAIILSQIHPFSLQLPVRYQGPVPDRPREGRTGRRPFLRLFKGKPGFPHRRLPHTVQPGTVPYTALSGTGADALWQQAERYL